MMTQNQIDLVEELRTVSNDLADWAVEQFRNGATFDGVQAEIRRVAEVVYNWRIGRGA
jgi:hypothetical protein